ncbi:hypothetical protein C8J57DRAFT_1646772 [Mycena rebaudengoi]|nr:hypothetical protein C8J57DRAFT_1646772 [Mycena rebaudengoi]
MQSNTCSYFFACAEVGRHPNQPNAVWEGAPALAGPLVEFYDSTAKTKVLGHTFVANSVSRKDQALLVRPRLHGDVIVLYHQLWRTLVQGYEPPVTPSDAELDAAFTLTKRPALPVELMHLIVRAAALMVPDGQQTKRAECSVLVRVTAPSGGSPISRMWFWTNPLDLAEVAAVQLVTVSRDGGVGYSGAGGGHWLV